MLGAVFEFWSHLIGTCVNWLFVGLIINDSPRISFGEFILACAVIGFALYFILGTDFIPNISFTRSLDSKSSSNDNYVPRHAPGNGGADFSTRVSRHK